MPPFFAHYFEAEVGRGCLLEYSICLMHMPLPPFLLIFNTHRVDKHDNCHGFLEASMNVYYRKSKVLLLILSQEASKQLAMRATKTLVVASEQGYNNFVCMCL